MGTGEDVSEMLNFEQEIALSVTCTIHVAAVHVPVQSSHQSTHNVIDSKELRYFVMRHKFTYSTNKIISRQKEFPHEGWSQSS